MIRADSFIKCNEIVGHSHARNILTESTILPLQYPELFSSVGNGWKCTLLHGPPGENKLIILLRRRTARTQFFVANIS